MILLHLYSHKILETFRILERCHDVTLRFNINKHFTVCLLIKYLRSNYNFISPPHELYLQILKPTNEIQIFIEFTRETRICEITLKYYRDFIQKRNLIVPHLCSYEYIIYFYRKRGHVPLLTIDFRLVYTTKRF